MPPKTNGEKLAELNAKIEETLALSDKENRQLTEAELSEISNLEKECEPLEAAIAKEKAEDELRRRTLARKAAVETAPRTVGGNPLLNTENDKHGFVIPVNAKRYGRLRYFKDERDAYLSGQWCRAHLFGDGAALNWLNDSTNGVQNLAMVSTDNAGGGLFVPEQMLQTIIDLREQYGVFRQKAYVQPMASDTLTVPRRVSGLTTYFVGETSSPTESEPEWNQVQLVCRTLATLTRVSRDLADDAIINIAETIANEIAYAMAVKEDQCGFLGTGTSTYGGMVGLITKCAAATATVSTAITGNTAFSTLDLADFEAMIGKLPEYPGIRPEWYIHKSGWAASMMRLADAAGGNTSENIEGARKPMFLGYPVNWVTCMNSTLTAQTSTNGLCYFGDLSLAATLGDRRGITVESSRERYFEYRQIGIQGSERFTINVHSVGDTSTAGAMIMLSTPAS